jgi:hypothetical protein
MKITEIISTPWAPYALQFSNDGSRLAIGGGSWYGNGGIKIVDLKSGESELFSFGYSQSAPNRPNGIRLFQDCVSQVMTAIWWLPQGLPALALAQSGFLNWMDCGWRKERYLKTPEKNVPSVNAPQVSCFTKNISFSVLILTSWRRSLALTLWIHH